MKPDPVAQGPALLSRLLDVVEHDIAPLTRIGVDRGDKIFGAAVLRKSDRELIVAATNEETQCPLWHGEVVAIREFYGLGEASRPPAEECLFLSTHEPCSLCLSAITWAGFDNFYYLFSYEDSRDAFAIPHDLRILEQVFGCSEGGYRPRNDYWQSHNIAEMIEATTAPQAAELRRRLASLRRTYDSLSAGYQDSKGGGAIPLA